MLPEPVTKLIDAFSRLPGVGPKTASRLTFFLLRSQENDLSTDLAEALQQLRLGTDTCPVCFNIMTAGREACVICQDPNREGNLLCVVEEPLDVAALEKTSALKGATMCSTVRFPRWKVLVRKTSVFRNCWIGWGAVILKR